ncbi:hypothetical protein TCAL_09510 [Tigriopus californicus]|uniref:DAGKc domain-containing protein n=1 Tax=Tigriopus californicus TaxID=6832 RepID=A0A553PAR2_TIGCA|nr:ceramide kinase-like [Tigriopus californicus]TRY74775.1 hypothetical protein TCAL_09510 [Tigriopus californicus]|eukprot:TCALIF_09510-PA protein Name:"Similar to CERK Ceramide kinase (Homo sapiens)" AED:0.07 eAED:0.07 QI:0/-1/0/1/-1/1/1/0/560
MGSWKRKPLSVNSDTFGPTLVDFGDSGLSISSSKDNVKFKAFRAKPLYLPYKEIINFQLDQATPIPLTLSGHFFSSITNFRRGSDRLHEINGSESERSVQENNNLDQLGRSLGARFKLVIHYLQRQKDNCNIWTCKKIDLTGENQDALKEVHSQLEKRTLDHFQERPKRLLIFINPYGGTGNAPIIFEKQVRPMFDLVGIQYDVIETERSYHAHDLLLDYPDLEQYDGVIGVGGDGILNEIFNGLIKSAAREAGLDVNEPAVTLRQPKVRIGIIPAGSTDSVAASLHGTDHLETAILHIILGDKRGMDVNSVYSDGQLKRFSITMVSYGYFGDLIQRSEKYRWMGPPRYIFSGMQTLLNNRSYKGTLEITMSDPLRSMKGNPSNLDPCTELCECQNNLAQLATAEADEDLHIETVKEGQTQKLIVNGEFMVVTGACIACCCRHTPKGVSPGAHHGDGNTDLILVKKTSRINQWRYLIRTSLLHASPFDLHYVEAFRAKEFKFTLENSAQDGKTGLIRTHSSVWNCDGEILEHPNIHVKVNRKLISVFGRGSGPKSKPKAL